MHRFIPCIDAFDIVPVDFDSEPAKPVALNNVASKDVAESCSSDGHRPEQGRPGGRGTPQCCAHAAIHLKLDPAATKKEEFIEKFFICSHPMSFPEPCKAA